MKVGVDYASVDGNAAPDWLAAKSAGVNFAFVRATYGTWRDPTIARDFNGIKAAGITRGAYMFPLPGPKHPSAEEQVAAFVTAVQLDKGTDFPRVLDVEFPSGVAGTGLNRSALADWVVRAAAALEQADGVKPILYTSQRVMESDDVDAFNHVKELDALRGCQLWLARYYFKPRSPAVINQATVDAIAWPQVPTQLAPSSCWIHQYQGDSIGLGGFTSTVDLSRFNYARRSTTGDRVRWVQSRLGVAPTGTFDDALASLVSAFQQERGLAVDGVVGPATFAALCWKR